MFSPDRTCVVGRTLSKTDTTLVAIVTFGLLQVKVTLAVNGSGLIGGLLLQPATVPTTWASVDRALSELGPDVGFLAAETLTNGTCQPVHTVASSTPRPLASQFKLFVLGACWQIKLQLVGSPGTRP